MMIRKQYETHKQAFSFCIYANRNKWYIPFGLAFWNRYGTGAVYYTHLIEISIGFLCCRFQFQWWVWNKGILKEEK